jgi:hypothetical protein
MEGSGELAPEVWGTFSVRDHCHPNAFVREVLLFDRLVLPVPVDEAERARWRQPNANKPKETWNPDRLDELRHILGSQHVVARPASRKRWFRRGHSSSGGHSTQPLPPASLAWESPWDEKRWQFEQSRVRTAQTITNCDAFWSTRQILAMGEDLPKVIEAVAAFPSAKRCRDELQPRDSLPEDVTAAQALVILATPLLSPKGHEGRDFGPLRAAVALAREEQFQTERRAYYEWLRKFVQPLQQQQKPEQQQRLRDITVDRATLTLAHERLRGLAASQQRVLGKREAHRWWTGAEYAMTIIGTAGAVAVGVHEPHVLIGVGAPLISFGGWIAGKVAMPEPPEPRPLGGASMFITAPRRLNWT